MIVQTSRPIASEAPGAPRQRLPELECGSHLATVRVERAHQASSPRMVLRK